MQNELVPRTGHLWVDVAVSVAIGLLMIFKAITMLRAQGILPPAAVIPKDISITATHRARNGSSGNTELLEYKISEIVEDIIDKKMEPLVKAHDDHFAMLGGIQKDVDRILTLMEARPRR